MYFLIILSVLNLVLIGVIVFIFIQSKEERSQLLDRIMSRDYNEYRIHSETEPKTFGSIGGFTDEEEAFIEQKNKEQGVI